MASDNSALIEADCGTRLSYSGRHLNSQVDVRYLGVPTLSGT